MRAIAFGIHPDDVELGCGGTVALLVASGHEVTIVDLTGGDSSSNGTVEERRAEAEAAAEILGVAGREILALPDTRLRADDPDATALVVDAIRRLRPDLVILPSGDDPHPDHASGGELIERALYFAGVPGYGKSGRAWSPRGALVYTGRRDLDPDIVVDVTRFHERKIEAILAHRSQFVREEGRSKTVINSPFFLEFLEARSRFYGWKIGVPFGEPFLLLRPLRVEDPATLFPEAGS